MRSICMCLITYYNYGKAAGLFQIIFECVNRWTSTNTYLNFGPVFVTAGWEVVVSKAKFYWGNKVKFNTGSKGSNWFIQWEHYIYVRGARAIMGLSHCPTWMCVIANPLLIIDKKPRNQSIQQYAQKSPTLLITSLASWKQNYLMFVRSNGIHLDSNMTVPAKLFIQSWMLSHTQSNDQSCNHVMVDQRLKTAIHMTYYTPCVASQLWTRWNHTTFSHGWSINNADNK